MRTHVLAVALVAASCSPWPAPNDAPRWSQPQGLGTFITEGAPLRDTTLDFIAKNERVYVLQALAPGYAVDLSRVNETTTTLFEVDPALSAVTKLPAAPIDVQALWPSDEARGFLGQGGTHLVSYDGSSWATLPDLPSATPDLLYRADAQRVFLRVAGKVYVLAGGAWHDLGANLVRGAGVMALGPWSATGVRVVWVERGATQNQACTQTIDTATFQPTDAAVCKDALSLTSFQGDAINGTVDDFQVPFNNGAESSLVWRFAQGAWIRGAYLGAARVRTTPRSKDLCVDWPRGDSRQATAAMVRVHDGAAAETLFQPSYSLYGCVGDERTCARNLDLVVQGISRDCTAAWFLADNFIDATRKVYLKKVDLPQHDAATCSPACGTGLVCIPASPTQGVCVADPVNNSTSSAMPASLVLQVAGGTGLQLPLLTFTDPDTGAPLTGFSTQVDPMQRTVVQAPPNTRVLMTVHLDGHADRAWTLTTPNENTQADLGTLYLVRGVKLGQPPTGQPTPSLATVVNGALVLPLRGADGGVSITEVADAVDGGFDTRALAQTDAQATAPLASPDARWLLFTDGAGLQVVELSTLQRTTVTSALTGDWLLRGAVFSVDGSTVAIPRGTTLAATVSVVALLSTPVERYVGATVGSASIQLCRDGAALLRRVPTGWEFTNAVGSYAVTTQQEAWLSGDGSRVYSASGNVGALTLYSQQAAMGAVVKQVATGVRSVTVDPEGADALFTTFAAGKTTVSRFAGATDVVTVVQAGITGQAFALTPGALWVMEPSMTTVFFPFSTAVGRVFPGSHVFAFDDSGNLLDAAVGLRVTPTASVVLPPGPGVFAGATRRLKATTAQVATLNGNTETSVKAFTALAAGVVVDARFTNVPPDGRQSYFAPCAVVSVSVPTFSIAPSGGAVTVGSAGAEVYCVR